MVLHIKEKKKAFVVMLYQLIPGNSFYYPTALRDCRGIVFSHGDRMGIRTGGGGGEFVQAVSQKP